MSTVSFAQAPVMPLSNFARLLGRWWLLLVLLAAVAAFAALRPHMIDASNIATILRSASLTGLMILGLTGVAAAGKIDVSFMQVAALADMVAAALVAGGWGWPIATVSALAVGAVVGLLNGFLVGTLRLQPLIVTIATGGACGSAAAAIGHGSPIRIETVGPFGDLLAVTFGAVPLIAVCVAFLYVAAWYAQEHLSFGRYIYAIARNEEAVIEAGVPTRRLIALLYLVSALTASAAGVLLVASLSSGQPMIGASYFIDGLTAVMVGGMMIRLGQPNVIGTACSTLLLAALVSGGALLGWPDYFRDIVKGGLLIGGVALAVWMARRSRGPGRRAAR